MIENVDVLSVLNDMGTTSHDVAQWLTQRGYQGERTQAQACPIAVCLGTYFPGIEWEVVPEAINGFDREKEEWVIELIPPRGVALFIQDFDTGHYPALVADA